MNPWPPVHLFTLIATFIHHFSPSLLLWSLFTIYLFHHTINRFVFCETGKIHNLSAVGVKVFWLSVCRSKFVNGMRGMLTFTLLLISRSYWFDKPRFDIEGKLLLAATPPSLWAPPNSFHHTINHLLPEIGNGRISPLARDGETLREPA